MASIWQFLTLAALKSATCSRLVAAPTKRSWSGERPEIPCKVDSVFCHCDLSKVSHLPLLNGQMQLFGVPTNTSFYISGPALAEYSQTLVANSMDPESQMTCFDTYGRAVRGGSAETKMCRCISPDTDEWTSLEKCTFDVKPSMCVKEIPELLRCKLGTKKVYLHTGHTPKTADGLSCEAWTLHSESRKVRCLWRPATPDGKTDDAWQNCPYAYGGKAEQVDNFAADEDLCSYDMKMEKCLFRLNSSWLEGKPWAVSD